MILYHYHTNVHDDCRDGGVLVRSAILHSKLRESGLF